MQIALMSETYNAFANKYSTGDQPMLAPNQYLLVTDRDFTIASYPNIQFTVQESSSYSNIVLLYFNTSLTLVQVSAYLGTAAKEIILLSPRTKSMANTLSTVVISALGALVALGVAASWMYYSTSHLTFA